LKSELFPFQLDQNALPSFDSRPSLDTLRWTAVSRSFRAQEWAISVCFYRLRKLTTRRLPRSFNVNRRALVASMPARRVGCMRARVAAASTAGVHRVDSDWMLAYPTFHEFNRFRYLRRRSNVTLKAITSHHAMELDVGPCVCVPLCFGSSRPGRPAECSKETYHHLHEILRSYFPSSSHVCLCVQ